MKIALVAAILAFVPLSQALAAEPPPEKQPAQGQKQPAQGIVVLRNGEIIEGRISHDDGIYVVNLPEGQIRLKDADVDVVCGSLEEGYQRKRATIQVGNVHDHLELAQWCLRHNLLGLAAVELADATAADPKNPMLAAMRHRLKMATEPPPAGDAKTPAATGPSNEDLDRMVRSLPRGSVETFTQSVQPVLMNHCTGSGCHGLQSETGMRLIRISSGKSPSRRFTQRNLYSVLQYVDAENPMSSKLLTAAGSPHGTVQHAVFNERETPQFKRLIEWVVQIAQRDLPETPATVAPAAPEAPPAASPPRVLPRKAKESRPLPPADGDLKQRGADSQGSSSQKSSSPKSSSQGSSQAAAKHSPPGGAPASAGSSADPFDPEVFNRRYAPEKPLAK